MVVSSRLGFAMRRLEKSVSPAVNGYLFRIRKGKSSVRRGMRSAFSFTVPKIQWDSNPSVSTAIRLWETFTSTFRIEWQLNG